MTKNTGVDLKELLFRNSPDLREAWEKNREKRTVAMTIRALRKSCGFSPDDMCKKLGVDRDALDRIESPSGKLTEEDEKLVSGYSRVCLRHLLEHVPADVKAKSRLIP